MPLRFSRTTHHPRTLGLALALTLACGGDGGGGGGPGGGKGGTIQTGPNPGSLIGSSGDLFWSESGEAPIQRLPASASIPVTLASRFSVPLGLAVTASHVYWTGERTGFAPSGCAGPGVIRTLHRTDLGTGATTLLHNGDGCSGGTGDVVMGGGFTYWVTSTSSPNTWTLQKLALAGGIPATVAWTTVPIVALAHDATHLYWMENDQLMGTALWRVPLAGGAAELIGLANGSRTPAFALNATHLFFTAAITGGDELRRAAIAGGTQEAIDTLPLPPLKLVADATSLYLADSDSLYALPVDGGDGVRLASFTDPPLDLELDGTTLLWSESTGPAHNETGTIHRVPAAGGAVMTELPAGGDAPRALAVAPSGLYWTEGGPVGGIEGFGQIARLGAGPGQVDTIASGVLSANPPLAVTATHVYVADGWRIKRVARGGGRVQTVSRATDEVESVAADDASAYWVQRPFGSVFRASATGGPPVPLGTPPPAAQGPGGPIRVQGGTVYWMSHFDAILSVPAGGGQVTPLATGLPFLSDFVVDDQFVYFSEQDGQDISRLPIGGGGPSFVAAGTPFSHKSLALDASNLYWIDQINVGRVSKAGANPAYLNPNALASDPGFPATIALWGESVAWTHPPAGVVQFVPR